MRVTHIQWVCRFAVGRIFPAVALISRRRFGRLFCRVVECRGRLVLWRISVLPSTGFASVRTSSGRWFPIGTSLPASSTLALADPLLFVLGRAPTTREWLSTRPKAGQRSRKSGVPCWLRGNRAGIYDLWTSSKNPPLEFHIWIARAQISRFLRLMHAYIDNSYCVFSNPIRLVNA